MKPDKLTIYQLFEMRRRYIVPLFQRPYVWNRESQWEPLWDDVTFKANQLIDRGYGDDIGSHFLGAAVINQIKTFGRQVPTYEVIDGQQRLTTLQILLTAFRSFLKAISYTDEDVEHDLMQLTVNTGSRAEDVEQYKVWPTTADRPTYQAIFAATSPSDLEKHTNDNPLGSPRLAEAYRFFYDSIDEYVRFGENDDEIDSAEYTYNSDMALTRIDSLMEALRRHLEIVVIELEKGDDPQIIFETLNARGVPLLPSDLIRNFVFLEASSNGEDIERLYNQYWFVYDDYVTGQATFWKEEEEQGRIKRPRIDLFMFYYLTMKTGREIKITYLFQEFRRWWQVSRQKGETVQQALQDIRKQSRVYQRLMTIDRNSRLGVFMNRLRIMDTATVYPLLLYLYGEIENLSDMDAHAMLTDLESYLVRRMICGLTAQSYNRNFLIALRDLRNAGQVRPVVLREILAGFEGDSGLWPGDDDFRANWLNSAVYRRISRARLRMVLEALDLQLETSKQEQVHIEGDLSIEHIYPQTPDHDAWAVLENPILVHAIGNLTLLTQALNSSVSNGPFPQKRPEIAKQSRLRLNAHFQELSGKTTWDQNDILARGEQLLEIAKSIWPAPPHQPPTRIPPGKQRTINTLAASADEKGVGPAFRLLFEAALRNGLYPAAYTNSIMYSPPQNKTNTLYTVWINPQHASRIRLYLGGDIFTRYFPVSDEEVHAALGASGWRELSLEDASSFVQGLDALIARTKQ